MDLGPSISGSLSLSLSPQSRSNDVWPPRSSQKESHEEEEPPCVSLPRVFESALSRSYTPSSERPVPFLSFAKRKTPLYTYSKRSHVSLLELSAHSALHQKLSSCRVETQ